MSDLDFATFVDILHHVAEATGVVIRHIDRWFPSTKLCSHCHQVNPHITLRDRVWTCPCCGVTHDRERNATLNINEEGASWRDGVGAGHFALSLEETLSDWHTPAWVGDPRIPRIYAWGVCQGRVRSSNTWPLGSRK